MKYLIPLIVFTLLLSCTSTKQKSESNEESLQLTLKQANHLSLLPMKCMTQEYPNKLGQVLGSTEDLESPKILHPAFYGCFDWHSAVHGHWMLVKLLKLFPDLENRDEIIAKLQENISYENIQTELLYFQRPTEKSYERTYGWAWLLKLAEELHTWDTPIARDLESNLQPLTDFIIEKYLDFLPRLYYPIRVGEHTNTAFGLCYAWDYAESVGEERLLALIDERARSFYYNDKMCPMSWEPSGYDFISPCLQEADLMRRVLPKDEFDQWLTLFLPQLQEVDFKLLPGQVSDRSDGKLVHLDGLNLSRAWCLYGIASSDIRYRHLNIVANEHISHSLPNIVDGDYMGEHWLASFAIYALTTN